jgi:prevent-host-death family protein
MQVTLAEAESRLPELIQAVEGGEQVVITRDGKPVAQIAPPPPERNVRFGTMRDKIRIDPHFDDPITEEQFISGEW